MKTSERVLEVIIGEVLGPIAIWAAIGVLALVVAVAAYLWIAVFVL